MVVLWYFVQGIALLNTYYSDWIIVSCSMKSITLHTLQRLVHLIFAVNSNALHTVQRLDHRIVCDEFCCFTQITVIGFSHVLQWIQLLYKYCSDWIIAFFCCNDFYHLTHITVIGLSHLLRWILLLCAYYSDWIIARFAMHSIALLILQWLDYRIDCN